MWRRVLEARGADAGFSHAADDGLGNQVRLKGVTARRAKNQIAVLIHEVPLGYPLRR